MRATMRTVSSRTALAFGLATILTALFVGGVFADAETTDYRTTKAAQPGDPDATDDIGAPEAIDQFPAQSVPTAPPPGRTCPATWLFFANSIMRYDLCYPPTWGFNDGSSTRPLTSIAGPSLYGVQLMSADAFPWVVGSDPASVAASRDATFVDFDLYQPHVTLDKGCTPKTPIPTIGSTAQWCGEYVSASADAFHPDPAGKLYLAKFIVPLTTDPAAPSKEVATAGYELFISVVTSRNGWTDVQKTIFDIVSKLRVL